MDADAGPRDLTDADEQAARAMDSLPHLPSIAMRVIEVVQDPNSSALELSTAVSADPFLSAQFLRAANSAAYRRSGEVSSVKEAVVLMGFTKAKNLAMGGTLASAFTPDPRHVLFRVE